MNPIGRMFIRAHNYLYRRSKGERFNMGGRVLLLSTRGAKTGKPRTNPLMYMPLDDDRFAVVASMAGAPNNPGWFHNLRKQPDAEIEIGERRIPVHARLLLEGTERDELYSRFEAMDPRFAQYTAKTERTIPVVVLEPRG